MVPVAMVKKIINFFFRPINPSSVCLFRIIFGLFMTYQIGKYFGLDYTYQFISGPELLFSYNELSFLQALPLGLLKFLHVGLLISALCITFGLWYRFAMVYFFIVFSYFSFVDSTLYNNHTYLISMISFAMIFVQADVKYRFRFSQNTYAETEKIPSWNQYILMFLIALPYFFGGVAKLSYNWLQTNLVSEIVSKSKTNFVTQLISEDVLVSFIKYGGLVYDLGIVFLLLCKKTRILAVCLIAVFNFTNNTVLFDDIGIFPFFIFCATLLYFDSERVGSFVDAIFKKKTLDKKYSQKEIKRIKKEREKTPPNTSLSSAERSESNSYTRPYYKGFVTIMILIFVVFHFLFPFRYALYTNNPEWTGVCSHFAWRMKLQTKEIIKLNLIMHDKATGATGEIVVKTFVSQNQYLHILDRPINLVVLAKHLKPQIEKKYNIVDPKITADVVVRFNGLPPQKIIMPEIDLTEIDETNYSDLSWVVPLQKQEKD